MSPQLPRKVSHDVHHRLQVYKRRKVRDNLQEKLPHHFQAHGKYLGISQVVVVRDKNRDSSE